MRQSIALLAAVPLFAASVAGSLPAQAQQNPTANDIIRSLDLKGPVRGIRPLSSTPAQPAPAVTEARPAEHVAPRGHAVAAAVPAAAPSVSLAVMFASNSADLTPEAIRTLDELGRALSSTQLASYRFRIEGHTDTVGSAAYNLALSEQRARAVAKYVEEKFGVAGTRLEAIGMGEKAPAVTTPDNTPEPRNRRVQIINLGA
jgi:OmpA-OmpF porin, OOP family